MVTLYPDSITAVAFVVVIVLGLAAYCRLAWTERDRDHKPGPMHPAYRCRAEGCTGRAVTTVWHPHHRELPVCGRCAQELLANGWYEEVSQWT